jgi:DNA invertase Pin-like site-specific DNA recombinase
MRLIGYAREVPDVVGPTYEMQEAAMRLWVKRNRHRLVRVIGEAGLSCAEDVATRMGFADALEELRIGAAEGIIVARLDRLALDVTAQELLLAEVWRSGGVVRSADPADEQALADEPADPQRALIRRVLDSATHHEGAMRDLRALHRTHAPTMSRIETEQAALARIEYMAESGLTSREIARRLTGEGFSPHFSHLWDTTWLRRIIKGRSSVRQVSGD